MPPILSPLSPSFLSSPSLPGDPGCVSFCWQQAQKRSGSYSPGPLPPPLTSSSYGIPPLPPFPFSATTSAQEKKGREEKDEQMRVLPFLVLLPRCFLSVIPQSSCGEQLPKK